jgi:hypothetical protein
MNFHSSIDGGGTRNTRAYQHDLASAVDVLAAIRKRVVRPTRPLWLF